ncbi:MAG: hypothetical protein L0207_03885 [Chlamydiae bacterium]|nr:hypothetical protein [Chlamydiota bacterium]
MKSLLLLIASLTAFSLEAAHFQSSMSVTQLNDTNEYLVKMQIEKINDLDSSRQLIASPSLICLQGQPAQLTIASEDKTDLLSIQVMVPQNLQEEGIHASLLMKEKDQVVLSFDNVIKLNTPK